MELGIVVWPFFGPVGLATLGVALAVLPPVAFVVEIVYLATVRPKLRAAFSASKA